MLRKMLRDIKVFGRCGYCQGNHTGHGKCVVTKEIQSTLITRTREKRMWREEIESQLNDSLEGNNI